MSIARRHIVVPDSYVHVTFRCLNREFFLKPVVVKDFIKKIWARYKKRYGVKIFSFIIMDNHAHLLAHVETAEKLGDFMRISNSLIARFINDHFGRDSHAMRERYKSPLIADSVHLVNTLQYIWTNRLRVDENSNPAVDPYCSFFYQANGLACPVLDPLEEFPEAPKKDAVRWLHGLLNAAKSRLFDLSVCRHRHTVGSEAVIKERNEAIRQARRNTS